MPAPPDPDARPAGSPTPDRAPPVRPAAGPAAPERAPSGPGSLRPPGGRSGGRARNRRRWVALGAAAALGAAWGAAHAWANRPAPREALRERAREALGRRLGAVEVGEARVDWLGRAVLGPVSVAAARPGAPPVLQVERAVVRPSLPALLAGRVEPASVGLAGVRLAAGPGGSELRALAERLRAPRAGAPTAGRAPARLPSLQVRDLVVVIDRGGRPVDVGPLGLDLDLEPTGAGGLHARGRVHLPGGGAVRVEARREAGAVRASAELRASLPGDLPAAVRRRLPISLAGGTVEGTLEASGDAGLLAGEGRLELRARDVALSGRRVGPEPLGPLAGAARGALRWDARAGTASLADGRLELGPAGALRAAVAASLRGGPDPRASLEVALDPVAWADLVAALPPALHPPAEVPAPAGTLSARLRVEGPPARPAEWRVDADVDLEEMRRASRAGARSWLLAPFRWRPPDPGAGEPPREVEVGPASPAFVPLAELPPWLPRAVTAAEDGGFWAHRGFDFQEVAEALRSGRGRLRGASTITQQLAKNLFLSPERTLSRKGREALATLALEATVPKARLLEIYLNLAEWGPGVHGVGEAARFWFGKDAREVTPKEAAFLASVIPSPRRFHARLARGGVSGAWAERIADILSKTWIQGHLSDEQLLAALDEPLRLVGGGGAPQDAAATGGGPGIAAEGAPAGGPDDEPADGPADEGEGEDASGGAGLADPPEDAAPRAPSGR